MTRNIAGKSDRAQMVMTVETHTVHIDPDGDLAQALESASLSGAVLIADTGTSSYRLYVERTAGDRPDVERTERSIEGIRRAAGSWKDIDAEALKAYTRERRHTGGRPSIRW